MSLYTVTVSNISSSTSEAQLRDFFALCGKISSINHSEKGDTASIAFKNRNATQTALMLDGTDFNGATLGVTSDLVHQDEDHTATQEDSYDQSDKPRAGIAAEYLAKGYVLSDRILERAIEIDNNQGISKRFLTYFHNLDKSVGERTLGPDQTISGKIQSTIYNTTHQARTVDEDKGYFKTYYLKAVMSPLGQKVRAFYTDTSKQVRDIHEEARRIADHENEKLSASKQTTQGGTASAGSPSESKNTPIN